MNDPTFQNASGRGQQLKDRVQSYLAAESPWVPISLVLLVTFLAYSGTLWFKFVYDDRGQILANVQVHYWRYAPHYFFERVWNFAYPGILGNYYRPIFLIFLLLNYRIFGPYAAGWHLVSVAAHVGVTYCVYVLVRRLAGDPQMALMAALIFGLDPVHIESVAWISGVTDPLVALFLLPSFVCYLNARERTAHRWVWLTSSLALYALGMLSKETALILPIIIFVFEWLWQEAPEKISWLGQVIERSRICINRALPFIFLTLVYIIVRWQVLHGLGHIMTPLDVSTIIFTWPNLLLFYFRHLLWPFNLSVFYSVPYVKTPGVHSFFFPLGMLFAVGYLAWRLARWLGKTSSSDKRLAIFACAWVLIPFIPLLDLSVLPIGEIAHDRYLYLPSIGFSILVAVALRRIQFGKQRLFGLPAWQAMAVLLLALLFGIGTPIQDQYWSNDLTLYARGVARTPQNLLARTNLGNAMGENGHYTQALALYHEVLERNPNFWLAVYNTGYTNYRMGNLREAEKYFKRAIRINGVDSDEYFYLGLTWMKLGDIPDAERAVRHALKLQPDGLAYHFAMGMILKLKGDIPGALAEFRQELKNFPGEAGAEQQVEAIKSQMERSSKR